MPLENFFSHLTKKLSKQSICHYVWKNPKMSHLNFHAKNLQSTAILILARKFKHFGLLLSCTMRDFWSICKYCDLRSKIFTEKIFEKVWTEKNWCCMEMNVKLGRKLRYAWIYVDTWFIIDVKWAAAASEQRATWTRYRGHGFEPSPSLEAIILRQKVRIPSETFLIPLLLWIHTCQS